MTGTVKTIREKGYGFLIGDEDGVDYFLHISGCIDRCFDQLQQGTRVEFEATMGERGPRAESVRPLVEETNS